MISNTSSSNGEVSSPDNHQQRVMVSSPIIKEEEEANNENQTQVAPQTRGSGERKPRPQLAEALKCPRCDSSNTKFCYYNNYRTTQPRYFCKTCHRYWTHGGTLRNVPVGGRCRKNKYAIRSSSGSSSSSPTTSAQLFPGTNISSGKMSINTQLMMVPNMKMLASETMGLFPNVIPTVISSNNGFNLTMNNQQVSLPFVPLSLSNQAPVLAPKRSGTKPYFLDILRRGLLHASGSNNNGGLMMSDNSNGKDMPFLLPSFGAMHGYGWSGSTTGDAKEQVGNQQGVDINDNDFLGPTGVQKQEVEDEDEEDKKAMDISNNDNDGSLLYRYWTNPNNNNNSNNNNNNNNNNTNNNDNKGHQE